jgi:hypothetical protein
MTNAANNASYKPNVLLGDLAAFVVVATLRSGRATDQRRSIGDATKGRRRDAKKIRVLTLARLCHPSMVVRSRYHTAAAAATGVRRPWTAASSSHAS